MATNKIQGTKQYGMFTINTENRNIDLTRHRRLRASMERYGFLRSFPIVVRRDGNKLIVMDGQHRLQLAESLGLPVWWIEEDTDFDIAAINSTAKIWTPYDYASKHASNGKEAYVEGLAFAEANRLPLGTAFALLAGRVAFASINTEFMDGTYTIRDRKWADAVAGIYGPIVAMNRQLRNARFIEACMAVCRVPDFDPKRLMQGAKNCREKLVAYSTKDGYLDMIESLYNWKRSNLVGLKVQAQMAMRERNPMVPGSKNRANPSDAGKAGVKARVERKARIEAARKANSIDANA